MDSRLQTNWSRTAATDARPQTFTRFMVTGRRADLQVVKDRLGDGSIATTGKYLHTLPTADETALDALRRTRQIGRPERRFCAAARIKEAGFICRYALVVSRPAS